MQISLQLLRNGKMPTYATEGSAGMDLYAAIDQEIILSPGTHTLIPCGFSMALPEGYEAQVRPRSGLALKHGITVLNTPGTIDADYRGEISVILVNFGKNPFTITSDMRIAQMIIATYKKVDFICVDTLTTTKRDVGGFGSTGTCR